MDRRVFIRQTAVAALGGLVAFDLSKASAKSEMAFAGKGLSSFNSGESNEEMVT